MFTSAVTLRPQSTSTTSGNGAAVDLDVKTSVDLVASVTAATGTLELSVETSADGIANWISIAVFPLMVDTGTQLLTVPGCSRFVRAKWIISGVSPSFAFSVNGTAVQVYATPEDFRAHALPAAALGALTDVDLDKGLREDSDTADGYLGVQYTLPLKAWGHDLRGRVCDLYALRCMRRRGVNPDDPAVQLLVDAKNDAIAWFERIAKGMIEPPGIIDSTEDTADGGAYVYTDARRGW